MPGEGCVASNDHGALCACCKVLVFRTVLWTVSDSWPHAVHSFVRLFVTCGEIYCGSISRILLYGCCSPPVAEQIAVGFSAAYNGDLAILSVQMALIPLLRGSTGAVPSSIRRQPIDANGPARILRRAMPIVFGEL
jgi:hypothetical protein